jgi:ribosome maturation factor RimP
MAGSSQVDGLRALAGPLAAEAGLVIEDITVTPAGKRRVLRIVVDLPQDRTGGVGMEAVAKVSQSLAAALETSDVMGAAPFVLEVSSPGVSRPLTQRWHWMRARGRMVKAEPVPGIKGWTAASSTGRLMVVDDAGIELDGERRLPWDQISRGIVQVEFGRADDEDIPDGGADAESGDGTDVESTDKESEE